MKHISILFYIMIFLCFFIFKVNAAEIKKNINQKRSSERYESKVNHIDLTSLSHSPSLDLNIKVHEVDGDVNTKKTYNSDESLKYYGDKFSFSDGGSFLGGDERDCINNREQKDYPAPIEDIPLTGQFLLCLMVLILSKRLNIWPK